MRKTFVLLAALGVLGGCSEQQINNAGSAVESAAPKIAGEIESAAPGLFNDAVVETRIESQFLQIDAASALHVAVTTHAGQVKLSGKVRSTAFEQRFIAAAKGTSGVKGVSASLAVDPHLQGTVQQASDFGLVAAVRANLATQAGLNAVTIGVAASHGVVTLSGNIKTPALRSTLVATAQKTAGVKRVVDRLVLGG